MVSAAASVIDGFSSVWGDLLPWQLSFLQLARSHLLVRCFPDAISIKGASTFVALTNEVAFRIARVSWEQGEHPNGVISNLGDYLDIVGEAEDRVREVSGADASVELNFDKEASVKLAIRLVWMLRTRVASRAAAPLEFSPRFPGAGIIGSVEADIAAGRVLIEVKIGNSAIRSRDCKQLLLYASLAAESGRDIDTLCWLNPRLGTILELSVDEVAQRTAGRSWFELRNGILGALSWNLSR